MPEQAGGDSREGVEGGTDSPRRFLERTHDLERLRKELRTRDHALAESLRPICTALAEVYFTGRYPGFDLDDPDWPDLQAKLGEVASLLETVKAKMTGASDPGA